MSPAVADRTARRKTLLSRLRRRRHEARVRFWRVSAVSAFFVVALCANVYVGAVVMTDNFGDAFKPGTFTPPAATAQMRRPLLDGTFCRNITFDNATSQSIEDKVERCDGRANRPAPASHSQFTWGK